MEEESKLNICRVCMAEGNELQSIFSTDDRCGPNMRLAEIIMSYASVQITVGDGLPENICSECAESAALFYIFKIKCEETDDKLRLNLVKSPSVSIDEPFDDIKSESQQTSDGKESAVKPQDYETLKAILNNLPIPETSPEVESQEENIVVEPEDLLMPIDDCVESVEVVASDTVDPLMDLKTEYDSSSTTSGRVDSDEKRKFHCKICDKNFLKNSHLTRHKKIHSLVKAHSCTLCHKSFARPEQLANHLNVHSGIKPHVCVDCGKGFNQLSNLKDHMRTHNGEKPFLCSTCGKGFNQLGNLRQHTVRHSGIKAHVCTTCGSGFASKGELCAHVRKHTGARPFVCPICEHGFTTSSSLTKHKRIHSGEKPYECEVCKMKFSRSGILARHMRTHTGEKPYVCHHCSRAFSQSNDLSSHLRIHTGEKPYICDVCGQAFRQTSALKTHKRTHMNKSVLSSNVVINMMRDRFLDSLQVLPSEACNTT